MTKYTFLLTAALLAAFTSIHATTIQSVQSGNWNTAATWNTGVPTVNDDVIISAPDNVTIDNNAAGSSCKSLTVNGKLVYDRETNFAVGTFNDRRSAFIVNGTFEFTTGYSFKIYGYLKFNTGSVFKMYSGGMIIDGTLGASTSVATGQAHLDVTDIGTLDVYRSTISIRNPHYDGVTPCIAGAKRFGNTIGFGSGNVPDVNQHYLVSETAKPQFSYLEVNIGSSTSRFKVTDIQIDSAVGIVAGTFENYSSTTTVKVKGDFNVKQGVGIIGNFEFNGTSQQNINPEFASGATLATFNGDLIVNNPTEVKSKINVTIVGGDLKFTQGKFDVETKTLTLERTPVGVTSSKYIITYNFYQDIGFVLIQNLSGNTLFPIGLSNSYTPVWVNATSGNFKASVTPPQTTAPMGVSKINVEWNVQRIFGPPTADMTVQWNTSDETAGFTSLRNNCKLHHYNSSMGMWEDLTPTGGAMTNGTVHTKTALAVDAFSPFTMFTSATLPVELTQFTGKKVSNRTAQLSWTTASEKGNMGFEIQKNTEGSNFETLGFEKSRGDAATSTTYTFLDNNFTKTAYYRLKQTDVNGQTTFSKIVTLENDAKNDAVSVFPNPILRGSLLNIQLADNSVSDNINVEIYNLNGQLIQQQSGIAPLQTDDWKSGVYVVKIVNNVNVTTVRVVKN
jgi:Secretion system C-terminal sorting domain